jgi:site-specific DNA-cytosine methylase
MSMVLWYLKLVEKCFATMNLTSWSFEEAPNPQLVKRMEVLKRSRSVWFDFEVVEFWKFGIPQTRKRTIGGNPWLIDRLRHDGTLREWRVIRDVLTPPENAVSLRSVWSADRDEGLDVIDEDTGETLNPNNEKRTRLLHELSFTVMGGHSDMYWHDSHINRIRKLSIEERKRLQTFPPDYILPSLNSDQVMGVGNAIPPLFAQKFMSGYRPA